MELQTIIAAVTILTAVGYIAVITKRKLQSLSPKSKCTDDCGCSAEARTQ